MTALRPLLTVALIVGVQGALHGDGLSVYIGTYTQGASEGIYRFSLDLESGEATEPVLATEAVNPSFLALHPMLPVIYAVGEIPGQGGTVSAFRIDGETGDLHLLNQQSSEGGGPCHVAVAPSGRHVAVANYGGGSVTLLPVAEDGSLEAASATAQHEGSSVHQRQQAPHAHSVVFDPAGAFLFAADLGIDKIMSYRYDDAGGALPLNDPPSAALSPGAGPRHFTFHPNGRFAYAVNELDNTVTAFAYDAEEGTLETLHSIGTLPDNFTEPNTTAEIRVHPGGRFLYASNRGHDSIARFALNPANGRLTARGHVSTRGETPRNFNLDPTGAYLLAANQRTDNVVLFRVDPETGAPEPTGQELEIPAPVCVLFVGTAVE